MRVRAWARLRGVPSSTAYKAVQSGRISRDADGKVDPLKADEEWVSNTRPRIDGRVPVPPTREPNLDVERVIEAVWCGGEGDEMVSVRVAEAVEVHREILLVAAQFAMVDRLAPTLAQMTTAGGVRRALHQGLDDAAREADAQWRRLYPPEDVTDPDASEGGG